MWRDHPFSQGSKITERAVVLGVGGDRKEWRGVGQNLKKGRCRQYRGSS